MATDSYDRIEKSLYTSDAALTGDCVISFPVLICLLVINRKATRCVRRYEEDEILD